MTHMLIIQKKLHQKLWCLPGSVLFILIIVPSPSLPPIMPSASLYAAATTTTKASSSEGMLSGFASVLLSLAYMLF